MTCIEDMDFGLRHVAAIILRFRKLEGQVVFAPKDEKPRLLLAHPCLPLGVGVDVRAVVVEEVALNVGLAGLIEKVKFIGPEIRVIAFHVGSFPTWRVRVVGSDSRFVRSALSLAARSAQKARRVFQFAPKPSLCATASWTMRASIRSGWAKAMRKPTGPP